MKRKKEKGWCLILLAKRVKGVKSGKHKRRRKRRKKNQKKKKKSKKGGPNSVPLAGKRTPFAFPILLLHK